MSDKHFTDAGQPIWESFPDDLLESIVFQETLKNNPNIITLNEVRRVQEYRQQVREQEERQQQLALEKKAAEERAQQMFSARMNERVQTYNQERTRRLNEIEEKRQERLRQEYERNNPPPSPP